MEEDYKAKNFYDMDRFFHAWQGKLTSSISPTALMLAYFDWAIHIANAPGKQWEILMETFAKALKCSTALSALSSDADESELPFPADRRFEGEEWQRWPYNVVCQNFLLIQHWWERATESVPGVGRHHQDIVSFAARQMLDMISPSNFVMTNPEILKATMEQGGNNLVRGLLNFLEDRQRAAEGKPAVGTEAFKVGEHLAITPGKVVCRNRLMELIQYTPQTEKVHAEPVLIVPAWIMKYYILDLSPHNSLVNHLVEKGHTVFMISWMNPGEADHDLGMDDYLTLGIMAAINAIAAILPDRQIHSVGYCLGGTLLTLATATMSREGYERLRTMTLLATQVDFTEAGELRLFIDESQLNFKDETGRMKDEIGRMKDETGRLKDETGRLKDETGRMKGETGRLKDETGRLKDEAGRMKDETGRMKDEAGRMKDEAGRMKDETGRTSSLIPHPSSFQMLRSNDLIWSRIIHDYLMGKRQAKFDLMAWNADAARMPARMHSEYLRHLLLNNDLFEGRYIIDGRAIVISDIHIPVFLVATSKDHVAPWRSVYKFHLPAEEVTFALTAGGHNAGIVSPPDHPRRTCQISTRKRGEKVVDPDIWARETPIQQGSWWVPWQEWLANHSSGQTAPPSMGAADKGYAPLCDAPGTYVLQT